ncbi:carbohydrate ABC transporter permease [Treponema sp. TIM-1]|uniref:carbohydrate ABC transporter permease n=1 Tax=Treponema sp. TIM-1 TaxID=2898417 RepID=UPI003980364A
MKRITGCRFNGVYLFLSVISLVALVPFYIMFVMGTYRSEKLFTGLPLWVSNYLGVNLATVLKGHFLRSYLNSMFVSTVSAAVCLFTSVCAAFALAKYRFRLKVFIQNIILLGMMLPAQIAIIGYIIELRAMHLTNTLASVVYIWVANPFSVFFMTQFMRSSVPDEMLESARMDGTSEPRILISIVVPCIKAGCITVVTLIFLWSWNSYLLPLIVINKQASYTLPLMIANIAVAYRQDYGAQMLALTLSTFPIVILYTLGSKYFINGITAGAVKG